MQHEAHTHGINMSALGRDKQSLSLEQETVAIEVPGLSLYYGCLLYTSPSPRDRQKSRMPSSA